VKHESAVSLNEGILGLKTPRLSQVWLEFIGLFWKLLASEATYEGSNRFQQHFTLSFPDKSS
jgi:hypothetical protein